jgi:hypothetical protein
MTQRSKNTNYGDLLKEVGCFSRDNTFSKLLYKKTETKLGRDGRDLILGVQIY